MIISKLFEAYFFPYITELQRGQVMGNGSEIKGLIISSLKMSVETTEL